jgi:O-acetyl-ADP-ribose deacetylase (regulator of RNase III)
MKTVIGDLITLAQNKEFDVIVHGCNCFNVMGAGIAPQIAKAFPNAYEIDQLTIRGDRNKLGTISIGYDKGLDIFIINAYTQYSTGGALAVDYSALESCFKQIKTMFSNKKIGYPAIGCGLAGGDWDIVSKIIDNVLGDNIDHTYVEWEEL